MPNALTPKQMTILKGVSLAAVLIAASLAGDARADKPMLRDRFADEAAGSRRLVMPDQRANFDVALSAPPKSSGSRI